LSEKIPKNGLKNILAITFSNNAAKEMKERILGWLKSLYFEDPKSVTEISRIIRSDREQMTERATRAIEEILTHYSDFQVRTIDSFMATVFKSSAIDFGYDPDFEILMDSTSLMAYAFNLFLRDVSEGSVKLFLKR
jgi:ATP-dependent exoDNAse (exonuclease V) beta subunit